MRMRRGLTSVRPSTCGGRRARRRPAPARRGCPSCGGRRSGPRRREARPLQQVALPVQLLAALERIERLEHAEERARHHVRSSLPAVRGPRRHRTRGLPLCSRRPTSGTRGGYRVASEPEHWRGTEPLRVLAPDGTPVGDTDVGLDPDALRAMLRSMIAGAPPGPRVHRAPAPGRADGVPGLRGAGSRADRQRDRRSGPTTSCSRRSGSWPRRSCAASTPSSTSRTTAARGTAARTTRARPGSGRSASRSRPRSCTASATRWGQSLDGARACTLDVLRRRQRERGRLPRGREPGGRLRGPGGPVLPEQRMGDQRADRRADRRRDLETRRGVRVPGGARRRQRRAGRVPRDARGRDSRAYAGEGPTLIEALTYRIGAHSTADDPGRYRDDERGRAAPARSTRSRGSRRGCAAEGASTTRWSPPGARRSRPRCSRSGTA